MKEKGTKFGQFYQKHIEKIIPMRSFFSVIFCFVFNSLIYTGTQILMGSAKHYDLTTGLDRSIPFMPGLVVHLSGVFFVLGSQLHFDHTPKQRRVVSICYGRLSVAIDLWNLFCIASNDEYTAGNSRGWCCTGVDPFYLPDRCTDQSVSVDSLSGKLDVFYRNSR